MAIQPIGEPIMLYGAPPYEARICQAAATFDALHNAVRGLEDYYSGFKNSTPKPSRLLPSPTLMLPLEPDIQAILDRLTFIKFLEYDGRPSKNDFNRALYLGDLSGRSVVVKFCWHHSSEAHEALAAHSLAPHMYLCVNVRGGMKMVVMDHLGPPWKNLTSMYYRRPIPSETRDVVYCALRILHDANVVFGDVRRSNLFGDPDDPKKVMLVDFDFAGKDVYYPLGLNTNSIQWVEGVEPGGKILQEHDLGMCARL